MRPSPVIISQWLSVCCVLMGEKPVNYSMEHCCEANAIIRNVVVSALLWALWLLRCLFVKAHGCTAAAC